MAPIPYKFEATPAFWKAFESLSSDEQKAATEVFKNIFEHDPFDPRLRTHKINILSSRFKEIVRSVTILNDLRAIFVIRDGVIVTLDIGTHDIYK